MSTLRRRLIVAANAVLGYFSSWFPTIGWFRSDAW